MLRSVVAILIILFFCQPYSVAQQGGNPFELTPRLDKPVAEDTTSVANDTGNPFDVVPPTEGSVQEPRQAVELQPQPTDSSVTPNSRLALIVNIFLFLALTILVTFFRTQLNRAYRAFLNDNMLGQLQRERETVGGLPYYLFYTLFFFSAGFFIYQLSHHFEYEMLRGQQWLSFLLCTGLLTAFFLSKHILLSIIAFIFPIQKEIRLYSMTIIVFSLMLGLLLLPSNLLLSFAPESLARSVVLISLLIIAAIYLFRVLRSLFIGNKFLLFHKFHFLLYICTVEIAPMVIIIRLFLG
jgi:hypothetical protein